MRRQTTTLARFADRQNGVVTRRQLLTAGWSGSAIDRRVRSGALIVVYPGVYRVGHAAPSVAASYSAAVLACGPGAVLADRAAGSMQKLVRGRVPKPAVLASKKRRIEGVLITRCRRLDRRDVTRMHNIPITTVARTVVDLAARRDYDEIARAVHQAQVLHGVRPQHVEAVLRRRPNAAGAGLLRDILLGGPLLDKLERAFHAMLGQAGLPLPEVNRRTDGHHVDCRWPDHRLTVELTSFRYHNSRQSWEDDRQRRREARDRRDRFREYTWRDVVEEPAPTLRELRRLLS